MKRRELVLLGTALLAPLANSQTRAFPTQPIRIVVAFPPGSGVDNVARFYGKQMEDLLGQSFLVENREGANGAIGLAAVKGAPADGYTLTVGSSATMSINPLVVKSLPYDPVKDFKPVGGLTRTQIVMVVPSDSKYRSVQDLLNAAKAGRGKVTVGTYSASYQLAQEWLASVAGVKFTNVPYKGIGQVVNDLVGGRVDFMLADMTGAYALIQAGKVRALAVAGDTRAPNMPEVPTIAESGYPEFATVLWNGFFVRADTPNDVTAKLADALEKVQASAAAKEYARKVGVEVLPLKQADMRKYQLEDLERMRRIANSAGIAPE